MNPIVRTRLGKRCTMAQIGLVILPVLVIITSFFIIVEVGSTPDSDTDGNVRRVIIDTDGGPDDAWAVLYLLHVPNVRIEAITCVKGNTNVTNVGRNILRVLTALDRENELQVYLGLNESMITPEPEVSPSDMYFGKDGFSDVEFDTEPNMTLLKTLAIQEVFEIIKKQPNEITFISLGPLTNLAMLMKLYPETRSLIKEIYIMGGNRHGVGNTKNAAEFNFYSDPESANIVINNYKGKLVILPWETASRANLVMDQTWRFEDLGSSSNPVIQILNPVEKKPLNKGDNWMPCDVLVAMAFVNTSLVTEKMMYSGSVELHGWLTRGQLVLDYMNQGQGNIIIIDNMDEVAVKQILMDLANGK